jgi:HD-GYP domain-containing protein (c-di-GMP phosphodiesterase class II)
VQDISLIQMVRGLSRAMDLISTAVVNHHNRVGYVAARLGDVLGLEPFERFDLLVAGLLHDVGALSLKSRLGALQFETDGMLHSEAGYRLIKGQPRLRRVSRLVRHHHTNARFLERMPDAEPLSNLLNLADRVDVLVRRDAPLAGQIAGIRERLRQSGPQVFRPEYLEAFLELSEDKDFLAKADKPGMYLDETAAGVPDVHLDLDELHEFSHLFSQIIDFRSRFTATHSGGVAATADWLAAGAGFDPTERRQMIIAGNLHDLGKLAVPQELLEKAAPLSREEFERIKLHALYSHDVLVDVDGLEQVRSWTGNHHERMDGAGYPYGVDSSHLGLGDRILTVADVFTAITEHRPYRAGMERDQAAGVLRCMVQAGALDSCMVGELLMRFDEANDVRVEAQQQALGRFQAFYRA